MTFLSPQPTRAVGLQDQNITINGRRSVAVSTTARGTLLRSSGDSVAIGLERSTVLGQGRAALDVSVHLDQCRRADSLTAIGIRDSRLELGDDANSSTITARVRASGAKATAIGLDGSSLIFEGGDDVGTVTADITGCWASGSQVIALRDSLVALRAGADRFTARATGPNALWGQRAIVRGWEGDDELRFVGQAEDVICNGFQGDDLISFSGAIRSTGLRADPTFGRIAGGPGFDRLQLDYLSAAQFQGLMRPFNDGIDRGFRLGNDATRYVEFEQVIVGGRTFDVSGVGL